MPCSSVRHQKNITKPNSVKIGLICCFCQQCYHNMKEEKSAELINILICRQGSFLVRLKNCKKRLSPSSCLSVCSSAWKNSAPAGRIFIKFGIWVLFETLSRKVNFHYHLTRTKGTLHKGYYTGLITFRSILLRMVKVSEKVLEKSKHTFYVQYPLFDSLAVYGIMCKNTE